MNWTKRLRWQVAVPVFALAAMAAAALPAAASAGPGAGPKVPVLRGIHGLTAGPAAPQAPVLPFAGDTPAVAATGIPQVPIVFDYTGSDKHGSRPLWHLLHRRNPSAALLLAVPVTPSS